MSLARLLTAGVAAVGALAFAASAQALSLTVQQVGDAAVTVNDNGVGDADADDGSIIFTGSTTNFTFTFALGQGDPVLTNPDGTSIGMNLTFNALSDSTGGTLNFTLTDENVTLPNLIDAVAFTSSIGGDTNGIATATTKVSIDGGVNFIEIGNVTGNNGSFSQDADAFLNGLTGTETFTFLSTVTLVSDKFGGSSGDVRIEAAVPVPAALPLFASALLGLGLLGRRRLRG